jgi:hypothetical protein
LIFLSDTPTSSLAQWVLDSENARCEIPQSLPDDPPVAADAPPISSTLSVRFNQ